jgi:hypothetical protein
MMRRSNIDANATHPYPSFTVPADVAQYRTLLEKFLPTFRLRVPRILNLDPIRRSLLGRSIGGRLPLRHDALQVEFADLLEELPATRFDVTDVEHRRPFPAQQSLQPCFPLDQRQRPQVLAVEKKQVEGEEDAFPSAEQQIVEHGTARVIDAGNLAIDDGILDAQIPADPLRQVFEVAERIPIPRDQIALAVLDVGE